jgi:putative ABC transport system permease protein
MPDFEDIVRRRIASLRLAPAEEASFIEELAQDLEDRYGDLLQSGASEQDALRQVTAELENVDPLRPLTQGKQTPRIEAEPAGKMPSGFLVTDAWKDLRYASRTMSRNPLFVLFVVLTLGLGIGANTMVYTLVNTLILNPLPVPRTSELASIAAAEVKSTAKSQNPLPISYLNLKDYQRENQVFQSFAGYSSLRIVTLRENGAPERLFAEFTTSNYFSTLDLQPAMGRFFSAEEDSTPGAHPVAVINYGTWQARFGGSADIIGRKLLINNTALTVIGIAPPKFIGLNALFGPDIWIPTAMTEQLLPNEMRGALGDRGKAAFLGVARLKPGVDRTKAQADITAVAAALAREYPEVNEGRTATVSPISDVTFGSASGSAAPIRFAGAVLLTVVGIVLLIACSNVANLLMARSAARQHELAVRLAIGAGRARLVRQLLTESMLLGLLGGALGLGIGYTGVQLAFRGMSGANFVSPRMDAGVFVFTLLISLATGFVFGTIPAMRASRIGLDAALREEARTTRSSSRINVANAFLVGQVAFSFMLLVLAGLFLRSIGRAYEIDPGFQTKRLVVFMTNPGQAGYDKTRSKAFYKDVQERIAAMPGVESTAWASNLPLWSHQTNGLQVQGRQQRSKSDTVTTILTTVDKHYFDTAGVIIERGRAFSDQDRDDSARVAIVNAKLANDYWPGENPLGKRIQLPTEKTPREVVGIARTANYTLLAEAPQLCVYVPLEQNFSDAMTLYVRTKGDPNQIVLPVQREVRAAGPEILANDIRTGRTLIDGALFQAKMGVALLSIFGLLALALASVGLYGIMAYSVTQRTREIGLRMALGADRTSVLGLVLRQGLLLVTIGVVLGLAASAGAGRLLSRMLYGVGASDPISVAGAALVLLTVAFVACYLPARWASRLDPLAALRES